MTEWVWWCAKEGVGGDVDRATLCEDNTVSGKGKWNHRDRGCGWRLLVQVPPNEELDEAPEWIEIPNPPGWNPMDPTSEFTTQVFSVGFSVDDSPPWTVKD